MPVLVRFVPSKVKWRQSDLLRESQDFDARALRDMLPRETEERVSVFLASDVEAAFRFAVLWAATRTRLQNLDYVLIDDLVALEYELAYSKTKGATGVRELDDNHYELDPRGGLCIAKVISRTVWANGAVFRVGRVELREEFSRHVDGGLILLDEVNPELRSLFTGSVESGQE